MTEDMTFYHSWLGILKLRLNSKKNFLVMAYSVLKSAVDLNAPSGEY